MTAGEGEARRKLAKDSMDNGRERSAVGEGAGSTLFVIGVGAGEDGRLEGLKKDGVLIACISGAVGNRELRERLGRVIR